MLDTGFVKQRAVSHESISPGWWPGGEAGPLGQGARDRVQVFKGEIRSPFLKDHALQHFKRWARESESVNKIQAKKDVFRAGVA